MSKPKRSTIEVQGTAIGILTQPGGDYISLTDMVRNFDGAGALIEQWLKNKDNVLFLGVGERINNPDFNSLEFEGIRNQAGRNSFFLSAKKWIDLMGAKGPIASAGRYGLLIGTTVALGQCRITALPYKREGWSQRGRRERHEVQHSTFSCGLRGKPNYRIIGSKLKFD